MNYVFGYGSLMNPKSLKRTLPKASITFRATLRNYQRKFNIPVDGYLYLNIVPQKGKTVEGVCIQVSEEELAMLRVRERGYACVDVTKNMTGKMDGRVYAFIAPDDSFPKLKILQSYIDTCLAGVPEEKKSAWLADTIVENDIEDDRERPKYANIPSEE